MIDERTRLSPSDGYVVGTVCGAGSGAKHDASRGRKEEGRGGRRNVTTQLSISSSFFFFNVRYDEDEDEDDALLLLNVCVCVECSVEREYKANTPTRSQCLYCGAVT